jgi:hypothetical protein
MQTAIAHFDLENAVAKATYTFVPDADRTEVEAFVSCLRSSLGLRAINIAFEAKRAGTPHDVTEFSGRALFDLQELPKNHLVEQLVHSSGFSTSVCVAILDRIDRQVMEQVSRGDNAEIDSLGILECGESGVRLILADELAVNFRTRVAAGI